MASENREGRSGGSDSVSEHDRDTHTQLHLDETFNEEEKWPPKWALSLAAVASILVIGGIIAIFFLAGSNQPKERVIEKLVPTPGPTETIFLGASPAPTVFITSAPRTTTVVVREPGERTTVIVISPSPFPSPYPSPCDPTPIIGTC